ncbi:hypothetical protein C8J55DRAFT_524749 [Lentinula edodes]|uniref:Uncharacterized protein n=1 Tax=Lentinula lateritia TaxID=40482 RepID=A0A9W8ZWA5_9AGAR|nr:hypothetical protein C8J55DRAFT_524749 [Lentinula edodes]
MCRYCQRVFSILSMIVPLYNTELSPPQTRGFLVGLTQQRLGIGVIVSNWIVYSEHGTSNSNNDSGA